MAIEDFGRSLLSQVHEQRRRQRKKRESYEKKAAIASVVVPVGVRAIENVIETKAANFLASEQMMARKNKVETAIEIGDFYENQEREIQASTLAGPEYFRAKLTPMWQTMGRERYAEEFHGMGPYKELTAEQVGILANREWEKHQQGLALARRMGSIEDYQTLSALNTKDVRPTNIIDLVGRQLSTVFGGKSTQEREQEAIAAIENSNIFTTAEGLNTLHKTYETTNKLPVAYSYANFIERMQSVDITQFEPKPIENIVTGPDGRMWRTHSIRKWDTGSEQFYEETVKNEDGSVKMDLVGDISDPEDKLKFNISVWNPALDPRLILNERGFQTWTSTIADYNKTKEEEEGYIPLNPNLIGTEAEYEKLTLLFNQVTKDSKNLKVSEETLLLLNQFFVTLTDTNIARGFEEELEAAVDAYATANDPDAVATYGQESSYQDPEGEPGEMILYHRNNLTDFQNIIDEIGQRKAAYYSGIAEDARVISESLRDDGVIAPTEIDLSVLDEVDAVDEVTTDVSPDDVPPANLPPGVTAAVYARYKDLYDADQITQEEWENFLENGELPKP